MKSFWWSGDKEAFHGVYEADLPDSPEDKGPFRSYEEAKEAAFEHYQTDLLIARACMDSVLQNGAPPKDQQH